MEGPTSWAVAAAMPAIILLPVMLIALLAFDRHFYRWPAIAKTTKDWTYEDKDGTGLARSANATTHRTLSGAVSGTFVIAIGIRLSMMDNVNTDIVWILQWLSIGWASVAITAALFCTAANSISRFNIGLGILLQCVPLLILETNQALLDFKRFGASNESLMLWLNVLHIVAGLVLVVVVSTVRRRPLLFVNDRMVDDGNSGSLLANLTFSRAWYTLREAQKDGKLDVNGLPIMTHAMRCSTLVSRLMNRPRDETTLWMSLFKDHYRPILLSTFIVFFRTIMLYIPSIALRNILTILEDQGKSMTGRTTDLYPWVLLMIISCFISCFFESWDEWITWGVLDTSLTSQLYAIIFRKCLRMEDSKKPDEHAGQEDASQSEDEDSDDDNDEVNGDGPDGSTTKRNTKRNVLNLLSVDVERVTNFVACSATLPCAIFETIFGILFLMSVLGWKSTLIGLIIPILLYPLHRWSNKAYSRAEEELMQTSDEKTHRVTEVLHAIKQIKFSASEQNWKRFIMDAREIELTQTRKAYLLEIAMTLAWDATPILFGAAALSSYTLLHGNLSASVAFTALSILELVQYSLSILPHTIVSLVNARVSMRRIQNHLERTEKQDYLTPADGLCLKDATIGWSTEDVQQQGAFTLSNLDLCFPQRQLSIITGISGAGKSLLLAALAGEACLISGSISSPSASDNNSAATAANWTDPSLKAFVAQSPWLENASIKDNILFGLPLHNDRFNHVIHACALEEDLTTLPDGPETEVGALGVNLSGGQRLRLTLARALYSRAELLILDDIFSAVDAHVGRHILEVALLGPLCEARTVIVATHHEELVSPAAGYIVRVSNGSANGTAQSPLSTKGCRTEATKLSSQPPNGEAAFDTLMRVTSRTPQKFVQDEHKNEGAVKREVYRRYIAAAGGLPFCLLIALFFGLTAGLQLLTSYVIKLLTETSASHEMTGKRSQPTWEGKYLALFVGLSVLSVAMITLKMYLLFSGSIRASRGLFIKLTEAVLLAPLRWVEKTPTGRLLNRFVADFKHIDGSLINDFDFVITEACRVLTIIASAMIVSAWMAAPAIALVLLAVLVTVLYLPGARALKRLESTARSPVLDSLTSVLQGLSTIRTFNRQEVYIEKIESLIDAYSITLFSLFISNCWLNIRQGALGVVFLACVLGFLLQIQANASMTGFVLSFALAYSEAVNMALWKYSSLEMDMNAAERVLEYIDVESESTEGHEPRADWPSDGELTVKNLEVGYAPDSPSILKGVTFHVMAKERVGIVGRTGSGKSTLLLALFRFLEQRAGSIILDGLDISNLDLHSFRKRLSLIPQDPVLFTGTLRSNLDPFDLYTDEDLSDTLRHVRPTHVEVSSGEVPFEYDANDDNPQSSTTSTVMTDLNYGISRGGLNVSQGQRQLVCLARAMLEQPRIMLLDEATSAVDFATDALIQKSIRERFEHSTLLVIAHRLGTVIDFDKILVLGDGRVVEYGTPSELYQKGAAFTRMVDESGDRAALLEKLGQ